MSALTMGFNTDAAVPSQQEGVAAQTSVMNALAMENVLNTYIDGSAWRELPPGEHRPDATQPLIGNTGQLVSNYLGNKFTRGWLAGAGGADVEMALGATALPIRPSGYNTRLFQDFVAATGFSSGQPLRANWDAGPATAWGPTQLAAAEWIPSTFTSNMAGLDPTTGNVGPRVFPALDGVTQAPTSQFYARGQVAMGGDGIPSVSWGERFDDAVASRQRTAVMRKAAAAGFSGL